MKPEILEKAIRLHDSIQNIDVVTEFLSKHEKAYLELKSGFSETAFSVGFSKDVQSFLLREALREYRARLVDELDKL